MKFWLIILGLSTFSFGFSQVPRNGAKEFVPDSTIKSIIKLVGSEAEREMWSGVLLQSEGVFKVATFSNSSSTEYLKMWQFPGSFKYSFSFFEVGKLTPKNQSNNNLKKLPFKSFVTESEIHLGITKEELISVKGRKFHIVNEGETETLIYLLNDQASSFLKRYNMPSYTAKYNFSNNRLINFSFGFTNE